MTNYARIVAFELYFCFVMLIRRGVTILFLFVLLFAGSGITYMVGHHYVRTRAGNREDEFSMGKLNPELLNISLKSFKKLPKDYISKQVFEVQINGIHYDIYKTIQQGDNVTLFAINDKAENALMIAFGEKSKQNLRTKVLPFFPFVQITQNDLITHVIDPTEFTNIPSQYYNSQLHTGVITPPPNKMAA